ncbi:hypothetical protein AYL99_11761 [Fonsecaea erecta]|uniref:Uncharacterized protein n=1 Tax=Fonsecaea erecta TaxID=1367422 RepID=A0A178Z399_9EURO|nr:hypothetical protein AYL99_11761 [Fonsecaea erecta]OAP54001.1 hypothetical protein AYL99_11761 [Fonsecaea erecta]
MAGGRALARIFDMGSQSGGDHLNRVEILSAQHSHRNQKHDRRQGNEVELSLRGFARIQYRILGVLHKGSDLM